MRSLTSSRLGSGTGDALASRAVDLDEGAVGRLAQLNEAALQITAVLLVPVAALCFVRVPILTLRQQARRAYRR